MESNDTESAIKSKKNEGYHKKCKEIKHKRDIAVGTFGRLKYGQKGKEP